MPFSHFDMSARRMVVAAAVIGLIVLAAGPARGADGGFVSIDRGFDLAGDRDRVAVVAKVTRGAALSGLGVGFGLGKKGTDSAGSISVVFQQATGKAASRGIKVDGFSMSFKAVQGPGCSYDVRLLCERKTYDWIEGRAYKVSVVRGAKNAQGWLWTVSIRDVAARQTTKLVSLRSPASQLAATGSSASLYSNVADCSAVTPVTAVVKSPAGAGSTASWGKASTYSTCASADTAAPVDNGSAKLSIR